MESGSKEVSPMSNPLNRQSRKQKTSTTVDIEMRVTRSSQSFSEKCIPETAKNKHENSEPMKYVQSIAEVHMANPKCKESVSINISCDVCDLTFQSFADLGQHVNNKHKRTRDFCCSACDGKFFTKIDLDNHYTDVHTNQKVQKLRNIKKGNKK